MLGAIAIYPGRNNFALIGYEIRQGLYIFIVYDQIFIGAKTTNSFADEGLLVVRLSVSGWRCHFCYLLSYANPAKLEIN